MQQVISTTFYRIKKEEEENHRNKKEITTKFDEEPFFNFIEEGLRIKIRVTTVIINQIHLCALRVLCGENSAKMNYSIK